MNMLEAYKSCLSKYAVFSGRARRSEYWLFALGNYLLSLVFYGLAFLAGTQDEETLLYVLYAFSGAYSLIMLLPGLAVCIRRLHDTGRSGAFLFIALIPFAGSIILLVFLCQDSEPGENAYGPNPKESRTWVDSGARTISSAESSWDAPDLKTAEVKTDRYYKTTVVQKKLMVNCIRGPIVGKAAQGEVVYVGRDINLCQLAFPDNTPGVSKIHCMLHRNGNSIEVQDLGSSFGTFQEGGARLPANTPVILNQAGAQGNANGVYTLFIGSQDVAITVKLL